MNIPHKFIGSRITSSTLDGSTSPVVSHMTTVTGDAYAAPGTGTNRGQISMRANAHPASVTLTAPPVISPTARAGVVDLEGIRFEGLRPTMRLTLTGETGAAALVWDQTSARLVVGGQEAMLMSGNMTAAKYVRCRLVLDREAGTVTAVFAGSTVVLPAALAGEVKVTLSNETSGSPSYQNMSLWFRRLSVATVWPDAGEDTHAVIGQDGQAVPSRRGIQARLDSAQSIPDSVSTVVTAWRAATGFGVPTGVNAGSWRPPAGRWLIHATAGFQTNTGRRFMSIRTQMDGDIARTAAWAELGAVVDGGRVTGAATALLTLDGRTDVWLAVEQRTGGPVLLDTGALVTRFDIQYLGP